MLTLQLDLINMQTKRIIGLTGGISTGKTTVSHYLETQYQIPVFDADLLARNAVEKSSPILTKIVQKFSDDLLLSDRTLDRQKLGSIIFHDPDAKRWLENQIHPFVRNCLIQAINNSNAKIMVLAIPLLFEAKMTDLVNEIWVVNCDYEVQLTRLMQRNNLSLEEAQIRIKNQWSLEKKIALADRVLNNNLSVEFLYQQIDQYLKENIL